MESGRREFCGAQPGNDHEQLLHDLRTQLTVITGNAQLLHRRASGGRALEAEMVIRQLVLIITAAESMRLRLLRMQADHDAADR